MKKIITILLLSASITAYAADDISVYLNGEQLIFEPQQQPIIQNDSTLVPFRLIFEKLDMAVQWFPNERQVLAQKEGVTITLTIDNNEMIVNSKTIILNTPPIIQNDLTFVPLRAVSEAAGADVQWDPLTHTVTLTIQDSDFNDWSSQVLALTNIERENNGLSPLKWDDGLANLAYEHCRDMAERNFFNHNNPDGETPFDRMKKAGISYRMAGENIAAGQSSPSAVVKSWMTSQGHRENILNPNFEYLGVGVYKGGEYGIYWAQEFATFR